MLNRRGDVSQLLLVLIQLAMLATVISMIYLYASSRTDSTPHFQEFYAQDMSLLSDLLVQAPGITTMTYSNIRQDQPIAFEFSRAWVDVIIQKEGKEGLSLQRDYGTYPRLRAPHNRIDHPYFLSFIKVGDQFSVQEAAGYLQACTLAETAFLAEDMRVSITKQEYGGVRESTQLLSGVHETLSIGEKEIELTDDKPNIIITVNFKNKENVEQNRLRIAHNTRSTVADNQYFSCLLKGQAEAFSGAGFKITEEGFSGSEGLIELRIDVEQKVLASGELVLSDRELGRIIGRALVVYGR